jgi:hypothetical protein
MFEFIHHPKYGCHDLKGLTMHSPLNYDDYKLYLDLRAYHMPQRQ